jgi:hypothetical protein
LFDVISMFGRSKKTTLRHRPRQKKKEKKKKEKT